MKLRSALAAPGLLACAVAHAATLPPAITRDFARRLDDLSRGAFERHDAEVFVRESLPAIITMYGGAEKMTADMRAGFEQMDAQHVAILSLAVRRKPDGAWSFIAGSGLQKHPDRLRTMLPDLPRDFRLPPYAMQPI